MARFADASLGRKETAMRIRKCHGLLAAAVVVGAVVAVPALAQEDLPDTSIVSTAKATPKNAGTSKDPQGLSIAAAARLIVEPGFDPPIVTGIDILVGKGLVWNGEKYTKCSKRALDRQGPKGCPRTSIMGAATATGMADTVPAHVKVVFLNGGADRRYAYATLDNPARVQETLVVKVTKLNSSKWDHREAIRVPKTLQVVAGVPIRLTSIRFKIGGKPYAKEYIASTSCPRGGWKYQVTAHYLYDLLGRTDDEVSTGSIACTK
jgi:hypothetical protein